MKLLLILVSTFLCSLAYAQSLDANRLCLHNGGEYFLSDFFGSDHNTPNCGGGQYYPSFTHWSAKRTGPPGSGAYPWRIRGWLWSGMMASKHGPTWVWDTTLQRSVDKPYAKTMTWDYPLNHCTGLTPHSGVPWIIYGHSGLPSTLPSNIAGREMLFPSSCGGFDMYLNFFAVNRETWIIPSTQPYYGMEFGLVLPSGSMITAPSNTSVYQYTWENQGLHGQYLIISGNEMDCTGKHGGNKGRSYMLYKLGDTGYIIYFKNSCTGNDTQWAKSLLVDDAVTIPVNVPGTSHAANPFAAYGFDTGVATITPLASSGQCSLMFMTEDYAHPGSSRIILAASPHSGPAMPYGPAGYRIPHAWDCTTNFFLRQTPVWFHQVLPGYPASAFGTTVGGHSAAVPLPAHPDLLCLELRFSSFSTCGWAPSASFMVTYF